MVTVEEIVDELRPPTRGDRPARLGGRLRAPGPGGSHPSYALGYSVRDNDYYQAWDAIGRDRAAFSRWLAEEVYAGLPAWGQAVWGMKPPGHGIGARSTS